MRLCHCCAGLVCRLYTGGLCAFSRLSPGSHSNLLPGSLPLPRPVVAMPPHRTVIVWSLMATVIESVPAAGRRFTWRLQAPAFTRARSGYGRRKRRKGDVEILSKRKAFIQIYNSDTRPERVVDLICREKQTVVWQKILLETFENSTLPWCLHIVSLQNQHNIHFTALILQSNTYIH